MRSGRRQGSLICNTLLRLKEDIVLTRIRSFGLLRTQIYELICMSQLDHKFILTKCRDLFYTAPHVTLHLARSA